MTSPDEHRPRRESAPLAPNSAYARYLFAVVASFVGLLVTAAALHFQDSAEPSYSALLGVVALTAFYGGLGPAGLSIAICWIFGLWLLVEPRGELTFETSESTVRWWLGLAVAVVIAGVLVALRARERRSLLEAHSARAALSQIEPLQQLSIALTGAVSTPDVARAVSLHAADILSADGVALGLVQGEELAIVDLSGIAADVGRAERVVDLQQNTLLTRAARTGEIVLAVDRATLTEFTDSAALRSGDVEAAMALPLRAGSDVIGSVGFLFDRREPLDDEKQGFARIVADLAGQALERAHLYDVQQESRRALERILVVAPRFLAEDSGDVATIVCREARTTFGADYGVLWRVAEGGLELLAVDPPRPDLDGSRLPLDDFPRLHDAIDSLTTSFVPDVLESSYDAGRDFVRRLGIRSSLRTPVVISGRSELVLSMSWQVVVSEPDPATLVVVRRFADQAGLALEQVERRRAQEEVAVRAEATRRLQDVTAALSQAATTVDVSNTCLEHALASVGAEAGFVVLTGPEGTRSVEIVSSTGYDDDELELWRGRDLDSDVPFAKAIGTGEPVWALTADELSAFTGISEPRSHGWVTVPLVTTRGARGALHLSLRRPRTLTQSDREWLQAMVSQCGQALERSGLYEEERRSRLRAEQLQGITELLSNALTSKDVANVVADEVATAVAATAVAVAAAQDGDVTGILTARGHGVEVADVVLEPGLASSSPTARALRTRRSVLLTAAASVGSPDDVDVLARSGAEMLLLVPLTAGRRSNGLLVVAWDSPMLLSAEDRGIVEALAGQAALALDRARRFESERAIVETLQRSVLPVSLPRVDGVQMAARYLPGSVQFDVGGDWFDAISLPDGKLGLVVGDVVGKGVQAAASMSQLRNAIRAFSVERLKPPSTLARLNRLANDVLDTAFATVVYLVLDPANGVGRLASAGHPPPIVAYPDGRIELLEGGRGLPLGTGLPAKYRQETVDLPAGTVILLYTDGLVERRGQSIDDGFQAVVRALRESPTDPDRLLEHVLDQVVGSGEREDDIALLAARLLPVAPLKLDLRVPAHIRSMELIRDAMRVWLEGAPLDRSATEDVVLATWEACANGIEHAVNPSDELLSIRAELEHDRVRVVVKDTGTWAPPSGRDDRGLGLPLIGALSTSVDIARTTTGTTVTIERALTSEPATIA